MQGEGSKGWGDVDAGEKCNENYCDRVNVKMMCWNVAGWARGDGNEGVRSVEDCDMRAKVISCYKPDVACLVETWLKGDEVAVFEGYHWFGHNRSRLSRKAVRGSGGEGILVKSSICQNWG